MLQNNSKKYRMLINICHLIHRKIIKLKKNLNNTKNKIETIIKSLKILVTTKIMKNFKISILMNTFLVILDSTLIFLKKDKGKDKEQEDKIKIGTISQK